MANVQIPDYKNKMNPEGLEDFNEPKITGRTPTDLINEWKDDFTSRVKASVRSTSKSFGFKQALTACGNYEKTALDEAFLEVIEYTSKRLVESNDYVRHLHHYIKTGQKLPVKYFKYNAAKLDEYYAKYDSNPLKINYFSIQAHNDYVLFMTLKLRGVYVNALHDAVFNVKHDKAREYNPLVKCPKVLRSLLPFAIVESDIKRAFPTFIDRELGIKRSEDVYSFLDKETFNSTINSHSETKGVSIESLRDKLRPIYGDRVNQVITEERFYNKGLMFWHMAAHEKEAINLFVQSNNIKTYVRLHDAVYTLVETPLTIFQIGSVKFSSSVVKDPEVINTLTPFYTLIGGKIETSRVQYADFFQAERVQRIKDKDDRIKLFVDSKNIIEFFNVRTDLLKILKENVHEPDYIYKKVCERISSEYKTVITESLLLIDSKPLKYYYDTRNTFGMAFNNGFFLLKDGEIKEVPLSEVNGFFAPHEPTQKHNFKYVKDYGNIADLFKHALGEENYLATCSMIGYLCHNYKSVGETPAILLTDEGANNDTRNGRRGKTFVIQTLENVKPTVVRGGSDFDPKYTHRLGAVSEETGIFALDDVPASFNFEDIYTLVTGSWFIEPKNLKAFEIPADKAPKIIITSNFSTRYKKSDGSTDVRRREYQFKNYFTPEHTPQKKYGEMFFSKDWPTEKWNEFYSWVFHCVAVYLAEGLISPTINKHASNFAAYFPNDARTEEAERCLNEALSNSINNSFSVGEFLKAHQEGPFRFEKMFNQNNCKEMIQVFLEERHKNKFDYSLMLRRWVRY